MIYYLSMYESPTHNHNKGSTLSRANCSRCATPHASASTPSLRRACATACQEGDRTAHTRTECTSFSGRFLALSAATG
jgi:hypothetical protein